jgi:uncharacterized protein (TIGR03067 family)
MRVHLLTAVAVGLLLGAGAPAGEGKKDREKLEGTWIPVRIEEGGNVKEGDDNHRLIFKGDEFTIKKGDDVFIKGKFKLDPAKKPRHIDMEITEDARNKYVGQTAHGIYALEKGELKWCLAEPGNERPTEFAAPAGAKQFYVVLKREKS